jgi:hypothetical protein
MKSAERTLPHNTLGHLPGFDFQVYAFLFLQITDHRKPGDFSSENSYEGLAEESGITPM